MCTICGAEEESEFHAVMRCPHATLLRNTMRERWSLPEEQYLKPTGPDWLLNVIGMSPPDTASQLILILWRAWFVRNKWTHEGKWIRTMASAEFLSSYWSSLFTIRQDVGDTIKGKRPILETCARPMVKLPAIREAWSAPDVGWVKINVDGAYMEDSGEAGIGVIIRDSSGQVLLTAWKHISDAGSAEEVEALACKERRTFSGCRMDSLAGDRRKRLLQRNQISDSAKDPTVALDVHDPGGAG